MKVLKFGGTSVGTPQRMKDVSALITSDGQPKLVVLSAMSGTTNTLVEISDYLYKKNPEGAYSLIGQLEQKYLAHVTELYQTDEWRERTTIFLKEEFNYLRSFTKSLFTSFEEKAILAQGEIISTNMVTNYLLEQGVNAILLSALDMIRT
ncbi:MAG: aspartate kinase, partial [Prevotella sp.]|nr:aspartate kinase [Prevotella sp.]